VGKISSFFIFSGVLLSFVRVYVHLLFFPSLHNSLWEV